MNVSAAYAEPKLQYIEALEVPEGCTVAEALKKMKLLPKLFPHIKVEAVGIFGKRVDMERVLKAGDRIEIYRPLIVDPKEARRQRV